jgi:hypothetical protein
LDAPECERAKQECPADTKDDEQPSRAHDPSSDINKTLVSRLCSQQGEHTTNS